MVVMRSNLYTPGNNYRMIEKLPTLDADIVVLDLEDSVPPSEKETARVITRGALKEVGKGVSEVYVRVNGWITGLTEEDLEAVIQEGLNGVVLPKTESKEQVIMLEKKLDELEAKRGLKPKSIAVQLLMETAKGIVNAYEAATASKRTNALIFGAVDYTRDMRVKLTRDAQEVLVARSQVPIAARAAGLIAIDYPYAGYTDTEGFEKDTRFGRQLGFEGRMLIHPSQIEPSHRIYSPAKEDVDYARAVARVFEEGMEKGLASVPYEGKMIDIAVYRTLKDLLTAADEIAEKDKKKQRQ
jgi:citrate lyase subunit beta/citryl-CoA lyase